MGTILFSPSPEAMLSKPVNQVCICRPHPPDRDLVLHAAGIRKILAEKIQGRLGRDDVRIDSFCGMSCKSFLSSPRDLGYESKMLILIVRNHVKL